jgi:hypothetical protein
VQTARILSYGSAKNIFCKNHRIKQMRIYNTRKNGFWGHAAHAKARVCIYDYSPQMKTIFRALERIEFMASHCIPNGAFQTGHSKRGIPTGAFELGLPTGAN